MVTSNTCNVKCVLEDGPGPEGAPQMKRQIGLVGGIAMIVGSMIGSGIFIAPGNLLKHTDSISWSLILWTLCGISTILMSFCYIELGVLIQKSGGEIAYFQAAYKPLHRYFGELQAFLFSWINVILINPAAMAINALAFGQYALEPLFDYGIVEIGWKNSVEYDLTIKVLAILLTCVFALVNIRSVKGVEQTQICLTLCKLAAMAIIIGVGLYNGVKNGKGSIPSEFDHSSAKISDLTIAAYSGFWAYGGWQNLNYLTEELVNPGRNLPLAIIIGIPSVMMLYLLVNLAYLVVLSKEALISSSVVAVAATSATLGPFSFIIPLLVVLSMIAGSNAGQFTASRIAYVASREGLLPKQLSNLHLKYLSPFFAIFLNAAICIVFVLFSSINALIDLFGLVGWIFYALGVGAVIVLRYTQPDAPRLIKVPLLVPILSLVIAIFLIFPPIIQQPTLDYLYVLLFSLVGVILYTVFIYWKVQLPWVKCESVKALAGKTRSKKNEE